MKNVDGSDAFGFDNKWSNEDAGGVNSKADDPQMILISFASKEFQVSNFSLDGDS